MLKNKQSALFSSDVESKAITFNLTQPNFSLRPESAVVKLILVNFSYQKKVMNKKSQKERKARKNSK